MPASFLDAVWLVPALPLAGAFLMLLVGSRLSNKVISWLCCGTIFGSFLLAVGIFRDLLGLPAADRIYEKIIFTWFPSISYVTDLGAANFGVEWGYLVDPLSSVMILVVTGVGFLIHVYSIGYMPARS